MSDDEESGFWQQQEQELQQQYEEYINGIPAPVSPVYQSKKGNTSWDSQQATTAETVISKGFHLDHSSDDAIL